MKKAHFSGICGVGMSAVKHEIDELNGEIKITSQKNIGTTFEFIVPLLIN